MFQHRSRPAVALLGATALIAGCQSYQAQPLDLAVHREAWLARTPGDEPVRAFAQRLAGAGQPSAFDPSDGLSLAEAEIVALVYNAALRLARLRAGVATASAEHAGLWEDPTFGLDFLSLTESVSNPYLLTPSLSFTIPISGRLEAEKARADAEVAAELTRVAELEWATRIEVRRAWLAWSATLLEAEQTERLIASIDSLVGSIDRLASAGEISRTKATLFTLERADQRRSLLRSRARAEEAELRVRSLLGVSPDAPIELVPSLGSEDATDEIDENSIEERSLTLRRVRDEYEVAEQTLRREVREQYPDLTIGPLAEFDRGDTLLGFTLSLPIPVLNANKQGIAEAYAERELARAAFETEYERLVSELARARALFNALREQRAMYENEIAPLVDQQLKDARALLGIGEGDALVLLESLVRVGRAQAGLIEARHDEALATLRLFEIVGPPKTNDEHNETIDDEVTP